MTECAEADVGENMVGDRYGTLWKTGGTILGVAGPVHLRGISELRPWYPEGGTARRQRVLEKAGSWEAV